MTDLIKWEPSMSVGVAILDEDHRRIMSMINKLYGAMHKGEGREVLDEIFRDMMAYINVHFEAEEELFEKTGYAGADEQKRQHRLMAQRAREERRKFEENESAVMPMEIMYFLKDWWLDHVMNADKKYATHLNAHGIR
ncbi:MAG: bacteriohemerythrin [Alphaproteobacteria bacterium]|nr:bacteriohemerythrin [Alphaproteobacteria bacterium]